MTASQAKHPTDHRALPVATAALHKSEAELVILFGSRARGDYNDQKTDIDVMLVQEKEPDASHRKTVAEAAAKTAGKTYGHPIPVELVWRTLDEFRFNRRFINSVETNAVRDGIIMPRNPESYSSHNYEDEETEYAYDWSNYEERLHHAETHLNEFIFMADHGRSDLVIGQQAQKRTGTWNESADSGSRRTVQQYRRHWNPDRQHPPLRPGDAGLQTDNPARRIHRIRRNGRVQGEKTTRADQIPRLRRKHIS